MIDEEHPFVFQEYKDMGNIKIKGGFIEKLMSSPLKYADYMFFPFKLMDRFEILEKFVKKCIVEIKLLIEGSNKETKKEIMDELDKIKFNQELIINWINRYGNKLRFEEEKREPKERVIKL